MKKLYYMLFTGLLLLGSVLPAEAQRRERGSDKMPAYRGNRDSSYLARSGRVNFIRETSVGGVKEAWILLQAGEEPLTKYLASYQKTDDGRGLVIASAVVPKNVSSLTYSVLIQHSDGQKTLLPFEVWDESMIQTHSGKPTELENEVGALQSEIAIKKNQLQEKEDELVRLRSQVDKVIEMSRLAILRSEKEQLETRLKELTVTAEQLLITVKELGKREQPANFALRQSRLTEQLRALADKARAVESQEQGRTSASRSALEEKQAQIAEVRDLNLQDLQAEVLRLKELKSDLQQELNMSDQELTEYLQY